MRLEDVIDIEGTPVQFLQTNGRQWKPFITLDEKIVLEGPSHSHEKWIELLENVHVFEVPVEL